MQQNTRKTILTTRFRTHRSPFDPFNLGCQNHTSSRSIPCDSTVREQTRRVYHGSVYGAQKETLLKTSVGFFVLIASGMFVSWWSSSNLREHSLPVPDMSQELVLTVGKGPAPVAIADVNH